MNSLIYFLAAVTLSITTASEESNESNLRRTQELGKPFTPWDRSQTPFPCTPQNPEEEDPTSTSTSTTDTEGQGVGLYYIKVPKTSSSQLARITTRIAGREAKRQGFKTNINDPTICKIHDPMTHKVAFELNVSHRNKDLSFLWTMIRHPEDRAISHFAMNCRSNEIQPTPADFLYSLRHDRKSHIPNLQVMFLYPVMNILLEQGNDHETYVINILDEYNLVGIYERHHESLVLLSMIMGVDVTDVLYDFEGSRDSRCGHLQRPAWAQDPIITDFFASNEWRDMDKGDYMLYDAVNRSLDMTIDLLGRENFERKLGEYQKLLQIGTDAARKLRGEDFGCGIQGLHPRQTPFADLKDLFWVDEISQEEKDFLNRPDFVIH